MVRLVESNKLEGYESVQRWMKGLKRTSRRKTLVESTWYNSLQTMEWYLRFVQSGSEGEMTPDDLIVEAEEDLDKVVTRLGDFFNWLQGAEVEGYEPRSVIIDTLNEMRRTEKTQGRKLQPKVSYNSAKTMAYSSIQGFYSHNGVRVPKGITPPVKRSKVRETDEVHAVFVYDEAADKVKTAFSALRQLIGNLSFRDQVAALCLLSTSQDPVDLFKLNVGFVRERVKAGQKRFYWEGERTKTMEPFKTFFSREASEMLQQYVEQEREAAEDSDPLFVKRNGTPMDDNLLNAIFRRAQDRMGINNTETQSPFRPKRFRHIFRDACATAGIDPGYTHTFMGHSTDISGSYLNKPRPILEAAYVRVEPYLSVFKTGLEEEVTVLREKVEEQRDQLQQIVNGLTRENLQLRETTDKQQVRIEQLENKMTRIEAILKRFQKKHNL